MHFFTTGLMQWIYRRMIDISLPTILLFLFTHYWISYGLFFYAGEVKLTSTFGHFLYYWMVTCATIGYGDAAPVTPAGELIVALFMAPTSLSLFAVFMAKISKLFIEHFRKVLTGMTNYNSLKNHILIMGYHPLRTHEIIHLLTSNANNIQNNQRILVVSDMDMTNPFMDISGVDFCRVISLKDHQSMERVAMSACQKIIVDGRDDNDNFVLTSHYSQLNPTAHISTYIADVISAANLQQRHPNVEVITENREELLVRALIDSGTSRVVNQLLRADMGQTLFVAEITCPPCTAHDIRTFIADHSGTFIGVAYDAQASSIQINPARDAVIRAGQVFIHYIAEHRIDPQAFLRLRA